MNKYLKEASLLMIAVLPGIIWFIFRNDLPDQLPIHFNIDGNADNYADKYSFLWTSLGLGLGTYLLVSLVPLIDPKKQIQRMGNKYFIIRIFVTGFISVLFCFIILQEAGFNTSMQLVVPIMICLLFILLGNFMPSMKPNYFVGVRTPWTLESDEVWNITHRWAGRIWTLGGIIILLSLFIIPSQFNHKVVLIGTIVLALIPVIHSYILYKKINSQE